jgi:perosamine synthetase
MLRYPVAQPYLGGHEADYLLACVRENALSSGRFVTQLEQDWAERCGTPYALAVMNGTVALHLALMALNLEPGDEVLVPTLTYVATANAVAYCGANAVLCDVDPHSWNLTVDSMASKVTEHTVGILPVHLYGLPCDMTRINEFAQAHKLWVVEDAAEAHGATVAGEAVGSLGTIGMFSLYGNKIITAGEGGLLTTANPELETRMRLLRGQGMSLTRRYYHPVMGYNYRMTNLQAAVACAQLEDFDAHAKAHREVCAMYRQHLNGVAYLEWQENADATILSADWLMSVLLPPYVDRDAVMRRLATEGGVETRPVFVPLHRMPMYTGRPANFPVAEEIAMRGLSLPTYRGLTDADVAHISVMLANACEVEAR